MGTRFKKRPPRKKQDPGLVNELKTLSEVYELDPVEILFEFLDHSEDHFRFDAAKELMQYMYPKQKAIEVKGHVRRYSDTDEIPDEELEAIVAGDSSGDSVNGLMDDDREEGDD